MLDVVHRDDLIDRHIRRRAPLDDLLSGKVIPSTSMFAVF